MAAVISPLSPDIPPPSKLFLATFVAGHGEKNNALKTLKILIINIFLLNTLLA
jgi:hypothetical protein